MEHITIKRDNYASIAGATMMLLSVFMPFLTISFLGMSQSVTLMDKSVKVGPVILLVSIMAIVFIFIQKDVLAIIASGINLIIFFAIQSEISKQLAGNSYEAKLASSLMQKGIGYYMLLIGAIVTIIAEVYCYNKKKK